MSKAKEPSKPARLTIYLDQKLIDKFKKAAKLKKWTLSNYMADILEGELK